MPFSSAPSSRAAPRRSRACGRATASSSPTAAPPPPSSGRRRTSRAVRSRTGSSSSPAAASTRSPSASRPSGRDYTYLFLSFVGLLYLVIGLFTVARERAPASRVFWALCLSSFAIYVITPSGPHDAIWRLSWLAEDCLSRAPPGASPAPLPDLPAPGAVAAFRRAPLRSGRDLSRRADRGPLDRRGTGRSTRRDRDPVLVPLLRRVRGRGRLAPVEARARPRSSGRGEAGALGRARGDGRARALRHPLRSPARSRVRVAPPLDRRRHSARLHSARVRVGDPEVAAVGRRDLRPRGDRRDGRRAPRRHDVRDPERASRPRRSSEWPRRARTSSRSDPGSFSRRSSFP